MGFYSQKSCAITGASRGIGAALAKELASRGARLALFARSKTELDAVRAAAESLGAEVVAIPGDVTRDADIERLVEEAAARFGGLDVAVANAGIGTQGRLYDLSNDDIRQTMEVNFFGAVRLAKAALPYLRQRGREGRLALVSSVAGKIALPTSGAYSASKFALQGFGRTLRAEEAAAGGPKVTLICPGFVESTIQERATVVGMERRAPPAFLIMRTETAARQIADAIALGTREEVITYHGKAIAQLERLAPGLVDAVSGLAGRFLK